MGSKRLKSFAVAAFSVALLFFSLHLYAQDDNQNKSENNSETKKEEKNKFDANEVIFGHISDAHEFHFLSYEGSDGKEHEVAIPLPVILYSPQKGWTFFMYSALHDAGEVDGYKLENGKIAPVDPSVKVYDLSLTRNVVQMLLALIVFVIIMLKVAAKYKKGIGTKQAPSGFQNAIESVVIFIRDEVAISNLGDKYEKYLPYLLTVFFFILINNIFGMIPGAANVSGNIAFTMVLALVSFIVIMFSSNRHYWGHIINPPVPVGVKPILIIVDTLSIFTKPFALIIRLFANMLAGHIIIICLISLIFIFGALSAGVGWGFSPVSVAFTIFIYLIEVLIAFLQAYIFTNLTAVFIGEAIAKPAHDH